MKRYLVPGGHLLGHDLDPARTAFVALWCAVGLPRLRAALAWDFVLRLIALLIISGLVLRPDERASARKLSRSWLASLRQAYGASGPAHGLPRRSWRGSAAVCRRPEVKETHTHFVDRGS